MRWYRGRIPFVLFNEDERFFYLDKFIKGETGMLKHKIGFIGAGSIVQTMIKAAARSRELGAESISIE